MDAILELMMFHRAALSIAALLVLNSRAPRLRRAAAGGFLTWMLLKALFSATRTELVLTGLPLLAAAYYGLPVNRQRAAVLVGAPTLIVGGYIWSAAVVVSRTTGEFDWQNTEKAEYVGNEMFRELLSISTRVPDLIDYQYGHTYYVQLVNPIPRFLWPGKPAGDAGLELARLNGEVDPRTGEPYLTRSPGIIGEMYWNFGLPGVFGLSGFGGWLVRGWDRMRDEQSGSRALSLVHAAGLAALFLFGRSVNMSTVYGLLSLYMLLLVWVPRAGRGPQ